MAGRDRLSEAGSEAGSGPGRSGARAQDESRRGRAGTVGVVSDAWGGEWLRSGLLYIYLLGFMAHAYAMSLFYHDENADVNVNGRGGSLLRQERGYHRSQRLAFFFSNARITIFGDDNPSRHRRELYRFHVQNPHPASLKRRVVTTKFEDVASQHSCSSTQSQVRVLYVCISTLVHPVRKGHSVQRSRMPRLCTFFP